jgi:hypothetical protein
MSVFGLGTTFVNALRLHWWRSTAASVVAFLLLFGAISATAEALVKGGLGEGAMVLLLPLTVFPCAILASGAYRWLRGPALTT